MIKDLAVIKNPDLIFEKKIVIWGAGEKGTMLYSNFASLVERGCLGDGQVTVCDADAECIRGKRDYPVLSIHEMVSLVAAKEDYLIVISPEAVEVQDEVIGQIQELGLFDVDICTLYGITWGLIFAGRTSKIPKIEQDLEVNQRGGKGLQDNAALKKHRIFIEGMYFDDWILVYQPGKVGSGSVNSSLKAYGKHSFHVHSLTGMEYSMEILQKKNVKIISMFRNPLERRISELWHLLEHTSIDYPDMGFCGIEDMFMGNGDLFSDEFSWFHNELEKVTGINIWAYPFDKESGYAVMKNNGIELLLLKCEKLNELEAVIGSFAGIENFRLRSSNIAVQKPYRFAYQDYKKEFCISRERFEEIFNDERLRYFYTDTEIRELRDRWETHVSEN